MAEGHVEPERDGPRQDGGEAAGGPRRARKRTYTKILVGLLLVVAATDLLLVGLGFSTIGAFRALGIAALLVLIGCLAWEVVERHERADGDVRLSAWIALPLAFAIAFASVVFMAISIHPPLLERITPNVVRASLVRDDERLGLEILFPLPVAEGGFNVKLDSTPVPATYAEGSGASGRGGLEAVRWRNAKTLWLDLDILLSDLAIEPPRVVRINAAADRPKFLYRSGTEVPAQHLTLE